MKTYIYTVEKDSAKRGFNRTVTVWRIKNNVPHFLAVNDKLQSAAWRNGRCEASALIAEVDGHKFDGYKLASDEIQLIELI